MRPCQHTSLNRIDPAPGNPSIEAGPPAAYAVRCRSGTDIRLGGGAAALASTVGPLCAVGDPHSKGAVHAKVRNAANLLGLTKIAEKPREMLMMRNIRIQGGAQMNPSCAIDPGFESMLRTPLKTFFRSLLALE
jgi:hypothetical protein